MTELVFILTDVASGRGGAAAAADCAPMRPRLRALETVLARAGCAAPVADWRAWLAARLDASAPISMPGSQAAVVAAAWDMTGQRGEATRCSGAPHFWLATPVHLVAGLHSVQMHPAGLLQLSAAEQHTLVAQFTQVFGVAPWSLKAFGQRELVLAGPAVYASGTDPTRFAATDLLAGLPCGPDAAALKRLGSEIELWLHQHPLNEARHCRGELAVTTLWLWGGEVSPPAAPASVPGAAPAGSATAVRGELARLYGRDTYAEALWRLHGAAAEPLPPSFSEVASLLDASNDAVLLVPIGHDGLTAALSRFEQRWLAAAVDALRRRRIDVLQLIVGTRRYRMSGLDSLRFWRARAPWWEVLT